MSVVLQIYAIIVTLSLIIVLSFYLFHRREVTRLSQKLQTRDCEKKSVNKILL